MCGANTPLGGEEESGYSRLKGLLTCWASKPIWCLLERLDSCGLVLPHPHLNPRGFLDSRSPRSQGEVLRHRNQAPNFSWAHYHSHCQRKIISWVRSYWRGHIYDAPLSLMAMGQCGRICTHILMAHFSRSANGIIFQLFSPALCNQVWWLQKRKCRKCSGFLGIWLK